MQVASASQVLALDSRATVRAVPAQFDEKRRSSARLALCVPIVLKGTDLAGKSFIEHTHTVLINPAGLKTVCKQHIALGARVQVAVPNRKRVSWATVTWFGEEEGDGKEVGIALDQTDDFWGVKFPEDSLENCSRGPADPQNQNPALEATNTTRDSEPSHRLSTTALVPDVQPLSLEGPSGSSDKLAGALRELAQTTLKETLGEVLPRWRQRAEEMIGEAGADFLRQAEERLRNTVTAAIEQLETQAAETMGRNQQVWEQTLQSLVQGAEEQLKVRFAEHEKNLAASAERVRLALARKLADASNALHQD